MVCERKRKRKITYLEKQRDKGRREKERKRERDKERKREREKEGKRERKRQTERILIRIQIGTTKQRYDFTQCNL